MIINTGERTDIPAYYSEWFMNRIKAGYVLVRNPYYNEQVTRYSLSKDVVDLLAFCTKNPIPMLPHLKELSDYNMFWFVTITPYGRDVEPNVPPKEKVMDAFKSLSDTLGVNCVSWRYDPILIDDTYTLDYNIETFSEMASNLKGYTDNVVISFIDLYKKTIKNFPGIREVTQEERDAIGEAFSKIGRENGILIRSCFEGNDLQKFGIDISGCMTKSILERAIGTSLDISKKNNPRPGCNCLLGNDIGAYNTCGHLCRYCYANYDEKMVRLNMKNHIKTSPFLIGTSLPQDKIHDADQVSYATGQYFLQL